MKSHKIMTSIENTYAMLCIRTLKVEFMDIVTFSSVLLLIQVTFKKKRNSKIFIYIKGL